MPPFRTRTALLLAGAAVVIVVAIVFLAMRPFGPEDGDATDLRPGATPPPPARTTAVPAPSGGSIRETVPPASPAKTYAADKTNVIDIPGGVQVRFIGVKRQKEPKAIGPGVLNDPVAIVTLEVTNKQRDPIDLNGVSVTLLYAKDRVGTPVQSELGEPFSGSLAPGEKALGTYVFSIPKESPGKYTILLQHGAGKGIAKFRI